MDAVEVDLDEYGVVSVVNESDVEVSAEDLKAAFGAAGPMVDQVTRWTKELGRTSKRRGGLVDRDRFLAPRNTFDQIRTARLARTDDIVDGISDLTESLAFKRTSFYADDEDQEAAWNLWAGTVNLDRVLRAAWHEYFTDSQVAFGLWWDHVTYQVPGVTDSGVKRRKQFTLEVPTDIAVLDVLKIAPVGQLLFGKERLTYVASSPEAEVFDEILATEQERLAMIRRGRFPSGAPIPRELPIGYRPRSLRRSLGEDVLDDPVVHRLILGRYHPHHDEAMRLLDDGVDPMNLFLLDEQSCFRHTATKPDYERFAEPRLRSALELLDMKQLARQKDRVFLLGGISFLVLITQGSDQKPALAAEMSHLRANAQTIAQVPILVGDHRLDVKIVTPPQDVVLDGDKWDTIDERLAARVLRQFRPKGKGDGDDKEAAQLAGHWLENERLMLRRTFEKHVFTKMVRRNDDLTMMPTMRFHPARVALAFDQAWATFLMDVSDKGDLSRDTLLSQFEMDQAHEARMREREAKRYDEIFQTQIPFSTPTNQQQPGGNGAGDPGSKSQRRRDGRRGGGNRNGGGAAPGTGQGQPPRNPRRLSAGATHDELLETAKDLGIKGRHKMRIGDLDEAIGAALEAPPAQDPLAGATAAGLCVRAGGTGRVLMLQRALGDGDPAAGTWEFPGGKIEDGEDPLDAARREWSEEIGHPAPRATPALTWLSPDGVYAGFVVDVPAETVAFLDVNGAVTNPDDPDHDAVEARAWWQPGDAATMPALRTELVGSEVWRLLANTTLRSELDDDEED